MTQLNLKRIFIVDDDPFWTSILSQMLSDLGCTQIVTFSNGKDCLKNLHLNPHLIFLDYQMDEMDGLNVLREIKDYYPGIGVVFCTAMENLKVAIEALKLGSYDYLLKSNATRKELVSILQKINTRYQVADKIY